MKLQTYAGASLPAPTVIVMFKGLMLLKPENDRSCTVGIHYNPSFFHELSITIEAQKPDGTSELIGAPLRGQLEDTFTIEKTSGSQGVFGFFPGNFSRASGDAQDLRWAIDLQNPREFHDPGSFPLTWIPGMVMPGIIMRDGVFYVSDRSDPTTLFVQRVRAGDNLNLRRIGTVIAASIPVQGTEKVRLSWRQGGTARTLEVPRPVAQDPVGTVYSVSIRNEPLSIGTGTTHDEVAEYYRVLTRNGNLILPNERFKLEMVQLNSFDSDRIPCMSVFLEE